MPYHICNLTDVYIRQVLYVSHSFEFDLLYTGCIFSHYFCKLNMHHECIRKSITSPQFFALNRLFFKQSVGSLSLMVCSQLEMVSSTWLTFQEQIKLKYFVKYTNSYATTVRPNSLLFFELCLLSARTRAAGPQTKLLDPNNLV